MVNQALVKRMQTKKAEILAPIVYATMEEDDTSAEVMEIAQNYSTDQTVCEMIVDLVDKMMIDTEEIGEKLEKRNTQGDDDFDHAFIFEE